jgi:hypothetical protein
MCNLISLFGPCSSCFRSRVQVQAEILAMRHQLILLKRSQQGRVRLRATDRFF